MISPEIAILKTDGINCDNEMMHSFEVAGAQPTLVHVNELRAGDRHLSEFQGLVIPGGFSYGDDISSGKILAVELNAFLGDQLQEFRTAEKPILGVCNGFQVLVKMGLLPSGELGKQTMTLMNNERGRFECRWIDLAVGRSACRYIQPEDVTEATAPVQVAHGEGRFWGQPRDVEALIQNRQVVFRYATLDGSLADGTYPANPNGSMLDIAGITDPSGIVVGMMPHFERSIAGRHPHAVRNEAARTVAQVFFRNIVNYAREV